MVLKNGMPYKCDDKGNPIITSSCKIFEIRDQDVAETHEDPGNNGEEPYFTIKG